MPEHSSRIESENAFLDAKHMHLNRRRLASGIDPLERKHLGGCADTRIAGKAPPGRVPKSGDTLHTIRREEPGDQGCAVEASESTK